VEATAKATQRGLCLLLGVACLLGAQNRDISLPSSQRTALPEKPERYALLVGIDRYEDSQINPLQGAANDARTLRSALIQAAGFPADQVFLLTSEQTSVRQPTRGNILRRLSNLKALIPPSGLLLFFFAGHGIQQQDQGFLLCSDSQLSGDLALLRETALNVDSLRRYIRETGVRQVILILDACRNEPGGRSLADNPLGEAMVNALNFDVRNREVEAFVTFYASAIGHRAFEFVEKKQGYFSWFLVQGLSGAAANERGEVTLASLIHYLQEQVPKRVLLDLGVGREQKPFVNFEGYRAEELVLAAYPALARNASPGTVPLAEDLLWSRIEKSSDIRDFRAYLEKFPGGKNATRATSRIADMDRITTPSAPPPRLPAAKIVSRPFIFETATLNVQGQVMQRKESQGKGITENCAGIPLELVLIPGGTFPMGLSHTEIALYQQNYGITRERPAASSRDAIQGLFRMMLPQHLVTVPSYYLGKYEITKAQWNAAARLPKIRKLLKGRPASPRAERFPIDQVAWEEAQEFCDRLTRFSGHGYRLPSEAEWEYACRAGSMTPYYFGETFSPELANCKATGGETGKSQPGALAEVGSRRVANAFGLFDMLGNVQEWCLDEWHNNYQGAPLDGRAWVNGVKKTAPRLLRGGAWLTESERCRSAERDFAAPDSNGEGIGFRVALEIPAS
jgi:formylglycine-generating enzyme required for sulfatase activity